MLSLLLTAALAQDFVDGDVPSINAQHFRPSLDGKRTLWADDAQRGEHKKLFLRPLFHYTHRPLVYRYTDGTTVGLVNNILQADLMAGFNFDRLRIGVDLPIYLFAEADATPSKAGLGDISIDGKLSILDGDSPVGLAVQGRVGLPTGIKDQIALGSPNTTWEGALVLDKGFGDRFFLMANLGYRGGPKADLENVTINDFFVFRAAGALAFNEGSGLALEFAGDVPFTGTNTVDGMPIETLLSGYARIAPSLKLRGGGGISLTRGISAPDFRLILGFAWEAEKDLDKDNDGIVDADDSCPDVPEDIDNEQDSDGCPEDIGSVKIHVVDEAGEPLKGAKTAIVETEWAGGKNLAAELASGDYVVNATADGYVAGDLPFTVVDPDVDKDITIKLKKVEIPMGTLKVVVKDTEGKLIEDRVIVKIDGKRLKGDSMPPGSYQVSASANGYRLADAKNATIQKDVETLVEFVLEPAQAKIEGERIDLRDSVYFDTNKDIIQERSFGLLNDVAGILVDHPELTKIRIEGHTDSRGKAAYNKDLSQRRADAVVTYLESKGVEATRLEAVGYGEERPLDKRETKAAWDKNRRVDFFVAERTD